MRSLGLVFGSGTQAASLTLATFMAGLGLGAWVMRKGVIERPLRGYALVEAGMAACALLSLGLLAGLPTAYAWLSNLGLPGPLFWVGKLMLASVIVLPQATLAGATMPLLVGYQVQRPDQFHQGLARLYLLNTLGAAAGIWAGAFELMPRLGLSRTVIAAAALNLGLAGLAWRQRTEAAVEAAAPKDEGDAGSAGLFPWLAMGIGAFGLGLELLWMRSLSLVIGASVYAFNVMLLAVLLGLVLGTWAYERWLPRNWDAMKWLRSLLLTLAGLLPLQLLLIGQLPAFYLALKQGLAPTFASHQWVGFLLSFFSLLLITAPLGMLFPLLSHAAGADSGNARSLSARLYAFNTAGAVLGALVCGFGLLPAAGLQASFAWLGLIPLSLGVLVWGQAQAWSRGKLAAVLTGALLVGGLAARYYRPWDPGMMSSGIYLGNNSLPESASQISALTRFFRMPLDLPKQLAKITKILYYREDAEAVVAVRESLEYRGTALVINGKPDASDMDQATQKLLAHLPLLLHPDPKEALVIGWGSGSTVGTAGLYPLTSIDCAELVPATLEASSFFEGLNRGVLKDPRLSMHLQDGRTYLLASPKTWDVISSEPPNPWISGVSNLFTAEFYAIASKRLRPGGVFCQFFHYYSMSADDLKLQFRTFAQAFPHASMWLVPSEAGQDLSGDLLLIGSLQAHSLDITRFDQVMQDPYLAGDLRSLGAGDGLDFYANCLLSRDDMLAFAGPGPLNTDDLPGLEFSAPRSLYRSKDEGKAANRQHFLSLDKAASAIPLPLSGLPGLASGAKAPLRSAALAGLARRSLGHGLAQKSSRLYEAAYAIGRLSSDDLAGMGEAFALTERLQEAAQVLFQALAQDPGKRSAYLSLGRVQLMAKQFPSSRTTYERMAARFPKDAEAWFGIATSAAYQGDYVLAEAMAQKTLGVDPRFERATRMLEQLRSRR